MNVSRSAPLVGGYSYSTGMLNWLNTQILPSGEWDGIYFDNLFGTVNHSIPNYQNPALLDVSLNNDGTRSTPAQVSDTARSVTAWNVSFCRRTCAGRPGDRTAS
jgi:hypothetical protein